MLTLADTVAFNDKNPVMLLISKDMILSYAPTAEDLFEDLHYAQDYYIEEELAFVSAVEFLFLMKTDNLTSH